MLHMRGICYTPGEYVTHQRNMLHMGEYVTHEGNMLHTRGICYT